jgi:hypothetical protein
MLSVVVVLVFDPVVVGVFPPEAWSFQAAVGRFVEDLHDALVGMVAPHLFIESGRLVGVSPERVGAEDEA